MTPKQQSRAAATETSRMQCYWQSLSRQQRIDIYLELFNCDLSFQEERLLKLLNETKQQSCSEHITEAEAAEKKKKCDERIAAGKCGRSELDCLYCEYFMG